MKIEHNHPDHAGPHEAGRTPGFADKLPIAAARVQVLKASYRQAWLYFLLVICLLVAWWIPIRYAVLHWLTFRPADPGPRDAHEFVALAYTGISRNPGEITPERFRAQIEALRQAGYHAISLRDVAALYAAGQPLPRKAILLTFDHARKSSYFDARKVLRRAGWTAVMFLWTKPIVDEDLAALRWPYIRSMLLGDAWEAGAQSHDGFALVPADNEGHQHNFMTTPRWFPAEMRYESPEDFRQRLVDDHQTCRRMIIKETGRKPLAYAFPYGDFGQFDERAIFTRRLNLDLVAEYYTLGFIHGTAALNTIHGDTRRLNRLLVQPQWTATDLLQRLEHAWPRTAGYSGDTALATPLNWLIDWGAVDIQNGQATMAALPETTGAKAWLNGSDLYSNFHLRLRLRITEGQFGFSARATPDGESYIYFGVGCDGDVWLRQKHAGMQPFTLAAGRYSAKAGQWIDLEIYLRDRLFHAAIDNHPVFAEIATIRGGIRPGMIGCSVWHPRADAARAEISAMEVTPVAPALLTWNPPAGGTPQLAEWLGHNAFRYTQLAPPWLRVAARGQSEQFGWNTRYFQTLAKIYSMPLTPGIHLESLDTGASDLPERLAQLAATLPARGVFCDLSAFEGARSPTRVSSWLQSFSHALDKHGLTLTARLPPFLETAPAIAALFQGLTNLTIAMSPDTPAYQAGGLPTRRMASLSYAAPPPQPAAIHELTGPDGIATNWPAEATATVLRNDGYIAFRAGAFDRAIEVWNHWRELEPQNSEPPALIGDVHLRRGDMSAAVDAYRASLELNPGQIELLVRCTRLMDRHTRQSAEAAELLAVYERIFPDNTDIILAQAEMAIRQNRPGDAADRINRIIRNHPDDLDARALLQGLLPDSAARAANLRAIREIGARPGMERQLLQAIQRWNLTRWPESWILMESLEQTAGGAGDNARAAAALLPRTTTVREDFHAGLMSPDWIIAGTIDENEPGARLLGADPSQTEAALRLAGSDTLRDGYIEAQVDDARGFFWLYARRSEDGMIRFGFEQSGRLYLQIWQAGRVIADHNRPWNKPPGRFGLRLELRGDGAFGYIDGQPAFGAPVPVPRDLCLGWWGIAPWAPHFGVAQALLREVSGGPLPTRMGIFAPRQPEWSDPDYLAALRPWTSALNVVAPPWYVQEANGNIRRELTDDRPDLRILCRYYQMRLMPMIQGVTHRTLDLPALVMLAKTADLSGVTLAFTRMPDAAWFTAAEEALRGTGITLLAVRRHGDGKSMDVREIDPASAMFAGARRTHTLPVIELAAPAYNATGMEDKSAVLLFTGTTVGATNESATAGASGINPL